MTNKEQFDKFIVTYLDDARKLAEIYVKNPEDAEDVVSLSIEKALRAIYTFDDFDYVKPWFNKIIINTSINHLKKQSKRILGGKAMTTFYFDDFSRLEFESLLDILPPDDKRILMLRFCDNYELKDIAYDMKMNENTVKTRLYRSLKKLKLEIVKDSDTLGVRADIGKSTAKTVTTWFIAILFSTALLFNLIPPLAAAAYDIPVFGDFIRVITFSHEHKEKEYEASINMPEIQGLLDVELQDRLNTEFREFADNLIRSFEMSILEFSESDETAHMSIKGDYEVRADNDRILSIDAYLYSETNGLELHKYCTIDKRSGVLVTLESLFKPDADYITPISDYLVSEMLRLNAEEGTKYEVGGNTDFADFTAIRPDHSFFIDDTGALVICFARYEIAPGFYDAPVFVIPAEVIKDIAVSDLLFYK